MNIKGSVEKVSFRKPYLTFADTLIEETKDDLGYEETQYWETSWRRDKPYHMYDVDMNGKEGTKITRIIKNKASKCAHLKINRISSIENPYLMASFLLQKQKVIEEYGDNIVKSSLLLHGTQRAKVSNIATFNLGLEHALRCRYGKGIYFTNDIVFASKFCDNGNSKEVIVANVLLSKHCKGTEAMDYPPDGYDFTLNKNQSGHSIFVKYEEHTFYPAYVVDFNIVY